MKNIITILLVTAISLLQGNIIAQHKMEKLNAKFGETFKLSNNQNYTVGTQDECLEIQIIEAIEEWGYDAPPEDKNRNFFSDVEYVLRVRIKGTEKKLSFYSSDVKHKDDFTIDIDNYKVRILSENYTNSSVTIEMIINKNDN